MKKQMAFLVCLILFGIKLMAISQYVYITNGFEPSTSNLALGGSPVAAVNYWHNDPLASYGNPAFTALHEGISYSTSSYNYMELGSGVGRLDYRASLTGIGYRGIGILASIVPDYGTEIDFGELDTMDEFGNPGPTIDLSEKADIYGIALDLRKINHNFTPNRCLLPRNMDIALGVNYIRNQSRLTPDDANRRADSFDLGILLRSQLAVDEFFQLEAALGSSVFNALNQSLKSDHSAAQETIYKRLNMAVGISGAARNTKFDPEQPFGIENLATLRVLGGGGLEFAAEASYLGWGVELGLGDMLFLREGYHRDKEGQINGTTYGLGLKLHYRDLISLRYDYAHFPVVQGFPDTHSHSFGAEADLIGWFNLALKTGN